MFKFNFGMFLSMGHELEVVRVEINMISNSSHKKYHVVSGLVFSLNREEMDWWTVCALPYR